MSDSDIPNHGARVRFDFVQGDEAEARYRVQLLVGDAVHEGEVTIGDGGRDVVIDAIEPSAPEWLTGVVRSFARQIGVGRKKDDGRWPRRVTRWRASKA